MSSNQGRNHWQMIKIVNVILEMTLTHMMKVTSPSKCGHFPCGNGGLRGRVAPQIKWDLLTDLENIYVSEQKRSWLGFRYCFIEGVNKKNSWSFFMW